MPFLRSDRAAAPDFFDVLVAEVSDILEGVDLQFGLDSLGAVCRIDAQSRADLQHLVALWDATTEIALDEGGIGDHLSTAGRRCLSCHRLIVVRCVGHGSPLARRQCGQAAVGCALVRPIVCVLAERHFAELQQQ